MRKAKKGRFERVKIRLKNRIGTPTHNLAKFLVPILSDITQNEFAVKDSSTFVDESLTQDSNLEMASLDVNYLFTDIPLDETMDVQLLSHGAKCNTLFFFCRNQ